MEARPEYMAFSVLPASSALFFSYCRGHAGTRVVNMVTLPFLLIFLMAVATSGVDAQLATQCYVTLNNGSISTTPGTPCGAVGSATVRIHVLDCCRRCHMEYLSRI